MIEHAVGIPATTIAIIALLVVIVAQLWTLLHRLWDFTGQLSYVAHLLERIAPPSDKTMDETP